MRKCVEDLPMPVDYALIDGKRMPTLDVDGETVVKGDGRVYSIAAASVIAKVDSSIYGSRR
ncbi:ribonuclease HII, variant [Saprolegnia diclina VS20]|uniref:Ribonuclease HII n=1 Tax=Saprolegnia diclina (strain VS20) TaxID=1156394 RepID=T0PUW7_SAPDV|nr:ribonuclease HII [Saprolegnia diclina VS20]XP_008621765.1 ribonuclease HII, variant [Saprolegnia diclina VS20]EQC24805.1 ribonuclease HII [Saprolegnia diclina VS20]EQC24806.1 ribonuclease HII, variant [Saprolegnia diclina VS20]|eukprot:XP_008621764.1 ribonuclease HII [Saprolegnia diclina VS20]